QTIKKPPTNPRRSGFEEPQATRSWLLRRNSNASLSKKETFFCDETSFDAEFAALQAQTLHQTVQGGAVHPERSRRDRAIALCGVERRADARDGGAVEIGLQSFVGLSRVRALGRWLDIALERKGIRGENLSAADDKREIDHVFQFS